MLEIVIAALALCVVYTYVGYPLLLWLWVRVRPRQPDPAFAYPPVTVIVPAYNEADFIEDTVRSILASDYPEEALDVIVVSDGSTDGTDEKVPKSPRVRLVRQEERQGKLAAVRRAAGLAERDLLLLADANSVFDPAAVKLLVRHFAEPRIGAVTGSKRTVQTGTDVSRGEGLYWRYEAKIRELESRTGSSQVGLEGGLFAIRRSLLKLDFPASIMIDRAIGCRVIDQGFQTRYDSAARVFETSSDKMGGEFSRKVRIVVRSMRSMFYFGHQFNPFRYPGFVFQNLSHKVFRRLLPFVLLALLVTSGLSAHPLARLFFVLQCVFYALAILGLILSRTGRRVRILSVPVYFTVVNAAAFVAWFMLFKDYGVWKSVSREKIASG